MLNLITINECIKIVNINTKTNYHKCIILSNIYASSGEFPSCSSDEVSLLRNGRRRNVPATRQQATKCPHDEMAGDEVYPQRNGWRRNVLLRKISIGCKKAVQSKLAIKNFIIDVGNGVT